jgi:hypothetical protein
MYKNIDILFRADTEQYIYFSTWRGLGLFYVRAIFSKEIFY